MIAIVPSVGSCRHCLPVCQTEVYGSKRAARPGSACFPSDGRATGQGGEAGGTSKLVPAATTPRTIVPPYTPDIFISAWARQRHGRC